MNVNELIRHAQQSIERLDAEILLCHVIDKTRTFLRTWPEHEPTAEQQAQFQSLITRREQGEPLAYIIGWREFWSLRLKVTPATLIPRQDTELLVEEALKRIPENANWNIADLGTGTGAIALAIASERPTCHVVATDVSPEALAVAKENAQMLGIANIEFRHGAWNQALRPDEQFQLIASNPPYVDADDDHLQHDGLPFEPIGALTPGKDGLADIRIIIEQMKGHLTSPAWLLLEHGYDQGEAVRTLLKQSNYQDTLTLQDLGEQDRVTLAHLADSNQEKI